MLTYLQGYDFHLKGLLAKYFLDCCLFELSYFWLGKLILEIELFGSWLINALRLLKMVWATKLAII